MNKILLFLVLSLLFFGVIFGCAEAEKVITLATTTSTENSGLLAEINPVFKETTGINIKVIALGTGTAIKTAEEGNADLILVHARSREDQFVSDGLNGEILFIPNADKQNNMFIRLLFQQKLLLINSKYSIIINVIAIINNNANNKIKKNEVVIIFLQGDELL